MTVDAARTVEELGFAVIPEVLSAGKIKSLLDHLISRPLPRSRAGIRHAMRHPALLDVSRDSRLIGIASEILGQEAFPFHATLFDKSPFANWLIVWHQDTALPVRERRDAKGWGPWSIKDGVNYTHAPASALRQILALRLHLDDSTPRNGPLRVLPGTHTLEVLSDQEVDELSRKIRPVECAVPSGGVLAMRPLLIHSSSKSQVENPRRVLHIEYAPSSFAADGMELFRTWM